jgi:hypothetical protein
MAVMGVAGGDGRQQDESTRPETPGGGNPGGGNPGGGAPHHPVLGLVGSRSRPLGSGSRSRRSLLLPSLITASADQSLALWSLAPTLAPASTPPTLTPAPNLARGANENNENNENTHRDGGRANVDDLVGRAATAAGTALRVSRSIGALRASPMTLFDVPRTINDRLSTWRCADRRSPSVQRCSGHDRGSAHVQSQPQSRGIIITAVACSSNANTQHEIACGDAHGVLRILDVHSGALLHMVATSHASSDGKGRSLPRPAIMAIEYRCVDDAMS